MERGCSYPKRGGWAWILMVALVPGLLLCLAVALYVPWYGFLRFDSLLHSGDKEWMELADLARLQNQGDSCAGRYIYVYDLPPQFNTDLVKNCSEDINWPNLCDMVSNGGLGPQVLLPEGNDALAYIFQPEDAWFVTDQFSLDLIFHERLKKYACLTKDPKTATLSYIPFYSFLDFSRTVYTSEPAINERSSRELLAWLQKQEHWRSTGGRSHVLVLSRVMWDYARPNGSDWGNRLLFFPEVANVTKISIEQIPWCDSPWCKHRMGIPYPTSFHPSSDSHIQAWQKTIRTAKRETLVLFIGAPRVNTLAASLRGTLLTQCANSSSSACKHVSCNEIKCAGRPDVVIGQFLKSVFCLQPSGDSATRKAVFDCLLAGGIPVFFDRVTAPLQYLWHLPSNASSYSVFFDIESVVNGKIDVIRELTNIPPDTIARMQKTVHDLVPGIVYRKPGSDVTIKDAIDLTIDNLLEMFRHVNQSLIYNR